MRRSKDELIEIWKDTETKFQVYPNKISSFKLKSDNRKFTNCKIFVENSDCMVTAERLSKLGRTCMLNMASYKHPGGGVKKGSMAQEEELSRRSNMMDGLSLHESDYPLDKDDLIYLQDVTFFKDGNYQIIEEFDCDVITIAAVNLNGLDMPNDYHELMQNKIRSIFINAYENECKNIVVSAFGCGVFKNDPTYVATTFANIMHELNVKYRFDNVAFAIINDHNADNNNYKIFKDIIG